MQQFFVAHQGEQRGPYTLDEICSQLHSKQLELQDYIYDEKSSDWVLLVAFPAVTEKMHEVTSFERTAVQKTAQVDEIVTTADGEIAWFVLKGENRFGPFAKIEVIKMLQQKSLHDWDYVWNGSMGNWSRISECQDFAAEVIRKVRAEVDPNAKEIFFRRRYARTEYGASIIIHNNKTVWRGKTMEISGGGAGLIIEGADLEPGHEVHLHFKPGDGVPPFNAACEVVSRRPVAGQANTYQYGVKFTKINMYTKKYIDDFAARKAQAA